MKIAVIGCGYVGLVTGACFAEIGHEVTCVDNDPAKITSLKAGKPTIYENFLSELLTRNRSRLTFGSSIPAAVRASEAIFIAVPTPAKDDGMPEMRFVDAVAREVAEALNGFKVIVQKSTVPVSSGEWLHKMISERRPDSDFEVVSNPEFLREGTAVTDFLYADRIVIGCDSEAAAAVMRRIYDPLVCGSYCRRLDAIPRPKAAPTSPRLIETSRNSAELIKYASNAFLSMKISFINAIANVCEAAGADIEDVAEGVGADSRIGPKFLRAGLGYGGSCFPKDVAALRTLSSKWGCELPLLHEVSRVNEAQRRLFLYKVRQAVGELEGKRIGVLGLSFKGGTDDIRCSPAIEVVKALLAEKCRLVAFDPAAMNRVQSQFTAANLQYAQDSYSAAHDANALLILTDWEEFANLDLRRIRELLADPIIVDGRNLYRPQDVVAEGLAYHSIGRAAGIPGPVREVHSRRVRERANATALSAEGAVSAGD